MSWRGVAQAGARDEDDRLPHRGGGQGEPDKRTPDHRLRVTDENECKQWPVAAAIPPSGAGLTVGLTKAGQSPFPVGFNKADIAKVILVDGTSSAQRRPQARERPRGLLAPVPRRVRRLRRAGRNQHGRPYRRRCSGRRRSCGGHCVERRVERRKQRGTTATLTPTQTPTTLGPTNTRP